MVSYNQVRFNTTSISMSPKTIPSLHFEIVILVNSSSSHEGLLKIYYGKLKIRLSLHL